MEAYASEWLQLLLRWIHLITGIAWIGASFYFVFLDLRLLPPAKKEDADAGIGGELWAIHGGGFYHAQKFRVAPATLPEPLHWFKWEAYWTWMSGIALLIVMYYAHADVYMIDRAWPTSRRGSDRAIARVARGRLGVLTSVQASRVVRTACRRGDHRLFRDGCLGAVARPQRPRDVLANCYRSA
jgi:uncharacterized membrane protein